MKEYSCLECGKKFNQKCNWVQHTKNKKFPCIKNKTINNYNNFSIGSNGSSDGSNGSNDGSNGSNNYNEIYKLKVPIDTKNINIIDNYSLKNDGNLFLI